MLSSHLFVEQTVLKSEAGDQAARMPQQKKPVADECT